MQVFRYDRTFEGLLTAVFDAYSRRTFPEQLIGPGEPEPLFAGEIHTVITDRAKSGRVWTGLQKKLASQVCGMLVHVWLSEEPQSDELLMRYIRKVFDSPGPVESNFADSDILVAKKIAHKVAMERLRLIQFVRFQKAADGSYFAPVAPQHNALPLTISHFTDRFADQPWLIYDTRRHYGYYYDLEKATEVTLDDDAHLIAGKLDDKILSEDEKMFQELWRGYFNSMTIKERINPKLHRQHLPHRFWKYLTEKQ